MQRSPPRTGLKDAAALVRGSVSNTSPNGRQSVAVVAQRLTAKQASSNAIDETMAFLPYARWTLQQREAAVSRLIGLKFFQEAFDDTLRKAAMASILPSCRHQRLAGGEIIFSQGDKTIYFYVVVTGYVEFISEQRAKVLGVASPGDGFGELGFITGKPRGLTARSGPGTQLVLIDADTYNKHLIQHAERRVRHTSDELRQVPVLQGLSPSVYMALSYSAIKEVGKPCSMRG